MTGRKPMKGPSTMQQFTASAEDGFERRVTFRPGYNYLHESGPQSRGQHGMEIGLALVGPLGAVSVEFNTGWTPLGKVDEPHGESWSKVRHPNPRTDDMFPSGVAVYIHWRSASEERDWLSPADGCGWLDGATCYGDASYTASDNLLRDFISGGPDAVWPSLREWYDSMSKPVVV